MQTQNTPPNAPIQPTQTTPQSSNLSQLFISVLQESVRQQPIKPVHSPSWLDDRFGLPSNAEDILWRLSWLFAVPAVVGLVTIPIAEFLWVNGYPLVVILVSVASALLFWGFWMVALSTPCQTPKTLIRLQLSVPVLTLWFVMVWEVISRG